ncbi:hypothetical protein LIER_29802 [Lithospermum erythrorhizon]|uniref:Integrase catalytic domain-containing protein n=1 Tax=Lithospermum erythrorhizon TaxID=34254 RepID=A0AAV3RLW8_LITER
MKNPLAPVSENLASLEEKAHSTLLLSLDDEIIREVSKQETTAGLWTKLESLYMTKSLTNKLLLKQRLLGLVCRKFLVSYENFKESMINGKYSITLEEVKSALHNKELRHSYNGPSVDSQPVGLFANSNHGFVKTGKEKFAKKQIKRGPKLGDVYHYCKENEDWKTDCPKKMQGLFNASGTAVVAEEDVRHVILMTKNLISFSLLDRKRFSFRGEGGVINVCKGFEVVLKGVKRGKLYFLQGATHMNSAVIASYVVDDDDMTQLWNMRLGHMSEKGMQILATDNLLGVQTLKHLGFCQHCVFGKLHRSKFPKETYRTKGTLDYIHSDYWGPSRVESLGDFKDWKTLTENQTRKKVKRLRADNGLEFCSSEFGEFCKEEGIIRHHTVRHTPQQNGVAERMNQTRLKKDHCMLSNVGLTRMFWTEAVSKAFYLINYSPHTEAETSEFPSLDEHHYVALDLPRRANYGVPPTRYGYDDMLVFSLQVAEEVDPHEPSSYKEAVTGIESLQWLAAMGDEMESL